MSRIAVRVENVSKQFQLGAQVSYMRFSELMQRAAIDLIRSPSRWMARNPDPHSTRSAKLDALRDVSFDVTEGEVVGIIGRNGAGKSTLLKVLSKITRPTSGRVGVCGRIGSLLEVGTGFHPELTGRENIFLNGAILGMTRRDVRDKFDAIVDFSELESFLDTPVKRYSSGMYTRLAFSVAAHLEPEILVVDEVLAVGDLAFQKKSIGKMGDLSQSGRTVLFVSHNLQAVQGLCSRVIFLDEGRVVEDGDPIQVTSSYLKALEQNSFEAQSSDSGQLVGNENIQIHGVTVVPAKGFENKAMTMDTPIDVNIDYTHHNPDIDIDFTLQFCFEGMSVAFPASSIHQEKEREHRRVGRFRSTCHIPGGLLRDGVYSLNLLVLRDKGEVIDRHENATSLHVVEPPGKRGGWFGKRTGVVFPKLNWTEERIESQNSSQESYDKQ